MKREFIFTIFLTYFCHSQANPLHIHLNNLNPIVHQEYHQTPDSSDQHGYESHNVITGQIHNSRGTSDFYSYIDDQGQIQRVEYIIDKGSFKILDDTGLSTHSPEVESIRQAHIEAFSVAQKQALDAQKLALEYSSKLEAAIEAQRNAIVNRQKEVYRSISTGLAQQQEQLNLFSRKVESNPTITAEPSKHYILPSPTVHHYEKIWPLPPLRFKDLSVVVTNNHVDIRNNEAGKSTVEQAFENALNNFKARYNLI